MRERHVAEHYATSHRPISIKKCTVIVGSVKKNKGYFLLFFKSRGAASKISEIAEFKTFSFWEIDRQRGEVALPDI